MHMFYNKFKVHLYFLIKKKKHQRPEKTGRSFGLCKSYSGKTIKAKCQEVNLHKLKTYLWESEIMDVPV